MKQVNVCTGFSLFIFAYSIIFFNSTFTLDMSFSRDYSLSAESDQETASLPIDKSPDIFEVGRFVLTIKIENS